MDGDHGMEVDRPSCTMVAFVLMRCALLTTIAAPEPRYTLECFPMLIALAAIAFGGIKPKVEGESIPATR